MICRIWRGWTSRDDAPACEELLRILAELDLRRASEESMTLDVTGH